MLAGIRSFGGCARQEAMSQPARHPLFWEGTRRRVHGQLDALPRFINGDWRALTVWTLVVVLHPCARVHPSPFPASVRQTALNWDDQRSESTKAVRGRDLGRREEVQKRHISPWQWVLPASRACIQEKDKRDCEVL